MEDFYTSLALVSAGVSFTMSSIHICLALKSRDRSYLIFGLMCFALFVFLLLPPVGFILHDSPPYPTNILFKRIFIFSYYILCPWFILTYSGYPKKTLAFLNLYITLGCFVVMALTKHPEAKATWLMIAICGFGCILLQGILAVRWQVEQGQRNSSRWLATAVAIYGCFVLLTASNQLTNGGISKFLNVDLFFPMHLHSLFFMVIMGQRLVTSLLDKFRLEASLQEKDATWQSFITNAPFIIVELDREGRIIFANSYGINLLGHDDFDDLRFANWSEKFISPAHREYFNRLYSQLLNRQEIIDPINVPTRNKNNDELIISWSNFPITNKTGEIETVIRIGKDITESEKASRLIEKLKNELIMEQVNFISVENNTEISETIIGSSKALRYAIQKAQQVATTHAPVFLEGETGVGKELFANLIHENSTRADKPFVKVNCGALPKELIEDELFGHEKGAFTSANQSRKGRFELADTGTIFLDEIGELPLDMQPKLLRVLQSGEFERIGGQKTIKVDVRILAATNRDLAAEVQRGYFRSDLYYRINVFPITIPPLRNRKEDLPILINYFILVECKKYNKQLTEISHANLQRLSDYDWPGNIRQLKNVIERSVIVSDGKTLRLDWWEYDNPQAGQSGDNTLEHIERDHILSIINKCNWRINGTTGAAEMLAMHPNTLRSKMKKLNIRRPENNFNHLP